ncbi:MAG: hypothetical protein IMZ54_02405 [Acidobacteria bacterium]|nr:hypothetical protein [Acidobacteriota bacterium]
MNLFANLVTIKSTKIEKIGTSESETVRAVIEDNAGNAGTGEVYGQPGLVTRPAKNTRSVRLRIGGLSILIAAFRYDIAAPDNPGETKLYSTDEEGIEKSTHVLTSDGKHVFNGGEDFAVRFGALETAFNSLKGDFNAHVHPVPGVMLGGPGTATSAIVVPNTASVAGAKVEEILIP